MFESAEHRIVDGEVPVLPPDKFLYPAPTGKRRIRPTRFEGYSSDNVVQRQAVINSRSFRIPPCRTEQYKNSFFVRTAAEWNQLSDDDIASAASPARRMSPPELPLH